MKSNSNRKLLNYLPAIYHDSEDLSHLLAVFEKILYEANEPDQLPKKPRRSLDDPIPIVNSIDSIAGLFDADETPPDFLPWLSRWVALTLHEGLTVPRQRKLVAEIVPLYALRGTKRYLEKLLEYFIPDQTEISIDDQRFRGFEIGKVYIGIDSRLGQDRPFWFRVEIKPSDDAEDPAQTIAEIAKNEKQIRRVIDLAKPAYTMYELFWPPRPKEPKTGSTDSSLSSLTL